MYLHGQVKCSLALRGRLEPSLHISYAHVSNSLSQPHLLGRRQLATGCFAGVLREVLLRHPVHILVCSECEAKKLSMYAEINR